MVDIAGDVARTMEGLNVGADVAMTMVELTQQKNLLFDQVEEMAKQRLDRSRRRTCTV